MEGENTEVMFPLAVLILCVLAIVVYIISGAGIAFYGLFVLAVFVMIITWAKLSGRTLPTAMVPSKPKQMRAARKTGKSRRRRA